MLRLTPGELAILPASCVEEKNSVVIASNEFFGGWTKTFTDARLCATIVDRHTFSGTIIETDSDSYCLASTRAPHPRAPRSATAGQIRRYTCC